MISCDNQKRLDDQSQAELNSLDSNKTEFAKTNKMINPGDICTVKDDDKSFGIVKVLVIDSEIAHLKIYKNKYSTRPSQVDLTTLSMGSIKDKDGFGIGHIPLARKGFEDWKPVVIAHENITEEELEGYKIWESQ